MTNHPPTQQDGRWRLTVPWNDVLEGIGGLTDDDFRDGMLHLSTVAAKNEDIHALEMVANAIGAPTESKLPDEICRSLSHLLTEAMAVGKEITLRKLARVYDPHGEFIELPADWIGNGPGVDE